MRTILALLFSSWTGLLAAALVPACGGSTHNPSAPADSGLEEMAPVLDSGIPPMDASPIQPEAEAEAAVPLAPGLLLYGGWGDLYQDTWSWSGTSWTQVPGNGPGVLDDQSMMGLSDGSVLLFGGEDVSTAERGTWSFSHGMWSQLQAMGPSARTGGAMAMLGGKAYLYGGQGSSGFLSDMWSWDGAAWTQVTLSGSTPGGRYAHSMATLGNTIVLFGNVGGPTDTWTFDGSAWKQAATVGPTGDPQGLSDSRGFAGMATLGNRVILFGGEQDANHFLNDTWAWDGKSWTQLQPAHQPPARFHPAMATLGSTIVLFGGGGAIPNGQPLLGDTWTFDGTDWTQAAMTGPSARYGYVMAGHQ